MFTFVVSYYTSLTDFLASPRELPQKIGGIFEKFCNLAILFIIAIMSAMVSE